jgi:hypothetical protein
MLRGAGSVVRERRTRGASPSACCGMLREVGLHGSTEIPATLHGPVKVEADVPLLTQSTPHSLTTRGSARRSLAATDATQEEETITTLRAEAEVRHDDGDDVAAGDAEDVEPMDED